MTFANLKLFRIARQLVALSAAVVVFAGLPAVAQPKSNVFTSPDKQVSVRVGIWHEDKGTLSQLRYEVTFRGLPVVLPSNLGVTLADGTTLGADCVIVAVESREIDTSFEQFPGKRRLVTDRCTETTFTLKELDSPERKWQLIVRAYDDGVALRYYFPQQAGWETLRLSDELTEWNLPRGAKATALPLANFTTSHENRYLQKPVADLPRDSLFGPPLLVEIPEVGWAAITEANLIDYAGMYLKISEIPTRLECELSPRVDDPGTAVRAELPHESPWRVLLVSDEAGKLIESDTLLKLNAPSVIEDVSWIKPGKTMFPWWNGYHEEDVPFKSGVNTATAKHYIDFCAEAGIPYHSLDGLGDTAWYGGPIVPYEGDDITTAVEGLDLPAVLDYAKQKGIRLRLWMHWQAAEKYMAQAFPLYRQWGIEGVMIDFMDRDDQEMIQFQHKLLQLAADNHLTVTFHGVASPTGLERTYPNLLNSEAVMNLEYDKWEEQGIPPEHDLIVAQTRMLGGPMDYHQGSFRTVPHAKFTAREIAPLVIGTPCRTLASYVVFQNHLPMVADYPTAYRRQPLTKILASVPSVWDDTRVLSGKLGEHLVIARRHGKDWWIGAMTNRESRELPISLAFLDDGQYLAEIYEDDLSAEHGYAKRTAKVASNEGVSVTLAESGGALIRLRSTSTNDPPGWELVWSDDFKEFDDRKWRIAPAAESLVRVENGKLKIRPANASDQKSDDPTGQIVSRHAQQYGRWEVRAKVPADNGSHSALRLLPDAPWPSLGEIDIMTSGGSQPQVTKSEFHWGTIDPPSHESRAIPQRSQVAGQLVSFPDGFHTYAVEWVKDQLRFYVDDVYHTVFYSDEVGDFLPKLSAPMRLAFDTHIAGDSPERVRDESQELLVDWVKIYERSEALAKQLFTNGSFEANGGSLAGWHVFGNRMEGAANITLDSEHVKEGRWSLAISGQAAGGENYSGVTQGISVTGGQLLRAGLHAFVASENSLKTTSNRATMKIEFYNNRGDYFGGPAMLSFEEKTIADADTPHDTWNEFELSATAPPGAVEARLSLVFGQAKNESGIVYVDDVEFATSEK